VVERLTVLAVGDEIAAGDLPDFLRRAKPERDAVHFELPPEGLSLEAVEKDLIVKALQKFDGNQTKAARYLDISGRTLIYRMEKHGISVGPAHRPYLEKKVPRPIGHFMSDQPATITYTVPEPFESTVDGLRQALSRRKLRMVEMLNLTERIQRRLSICTLPCVVLLVTPTVSGFDALRSSRAASLFLPLHIVISGRGSQPEVHILRTSQVDSESMDTATRFELRRLQEDVTSAIVASMRLTMNA
jgi:uncharacterized protein (DUF302 family)